MLRVPEPSARQGGAAIDGRAPGRKSSRGHFCGQLLIKTLATRPTAPSTPTQRTGRAPSAPPHPGRQASTQRRSVNIRSPLHSLPKRPGPPFKALSLHRAINGPTGLADGTPLCCRYLPAGGASPRKKKRTSTFGILIVTLVVFILTYFGSFNYRVD